MQEISKQQIRFDLLSYTVSWGRIIPRQKYQKIVPATILNLVRALGVGRSGKAKKVGVPQRPSEIMANNHMGG